jgi:hypothetical protein
MLKSLTKKSLLASAGLIVMLTLLAGTANGRRDATNASQQPGSSVAPASLVHPGTDPVRARFERLSEHELKSVYRRCNEEALAQRLGSGEIAFCAVAYEVLLKEHFNGEFEALLRWSRRS